MRHQNVTVGQAVRIKGRLTHLWQNYTMVLDGFTDAAGQPLTPGPHRVARMYTRGHYREPWIELEGINGQFRASQLEPKYPRRIGYARPRGSA